MVKYAQLTKFGVRRLYKVPTGCTLSIDEYAAQNGFKTIVEPEKPTEGYWRHEWHETETEVVLTWIETDPPEPEPWEISYSRGQENDEKDLTETE